MAWIDDFAPSMGAAISYYTMFSLAPLLVIVIAVAGALFGTEAVQGQIAAQLSGLIGQEGAQAVQALVKSANEPSRGLIAGAISVVVLIAIVSGIAALMLSRNAKRRTPPMVPLLIASSMMSPDEAMMPPSTMIAAQSASIDSARTPSGP